jgi:hypothetical protein
MFTFFVTGHKQENRCTQGRAQHPAAWIGLSPAHPSHANKSVLGGFVMWMTKL